MTQGQKHALIYGGGVIVIGIAAAYVYSKKQAAVSATNFQQLGTDGAIPNTADFGADFIGNQVGDFGALGEPVANFGPGSDLTLPPPYVEPVPVSMPKRKRCGCCPDDTMQPAAQITQNIAPLLNEMYRSSGVAFWNGVN